MICVGIYRKIKTFFSASGVRFSDGQNGRASTQENIRTKPTFQYALATGSSKGAPLTSQFS